MILKVCLDNKGFVLKNCFFLTIAIFYTQIFQLKIFVWLTQDPNIFKHISINIGATMKA